MASYWHCLKKQGKLSRLIPNLSRCCPWDGTQMIFLLPSSSGSSNSQVYTWVRFLSLSVHSTSTTCLRSNINLRSRVLANGVSLTENSSSSWMASLRSQHLEQEEYDAERTSFLESKGYRILRFWNIEQPDPNLSIHSRQLHPGFRSSVSNQFFAPVHILRQCLYSDQRLPCAPHGSRLWWLGRC